MKIFKFLRFWFKFNLENYREEKYYSFTWYLTALICYIPYLLITILKDFFEDLHLAKIEKLKQKKRFWRNWRKIKNEDL